MRKHLLIKAWNCFAAKAKLLAIQQALD